MITSLPDRSIGAVICSPPYGEQRKGHYPGVKESEWVEWFCKWMTAAAPKLTKDGSVLVVIRAPQKMGRVRPFVLETRLALQKIGWFEPDELIWAKPDAPGGHGSTIRLRHSFENILWFAQNKPYIDTKAGGQESNRIGFKNADRHGLTHNTSVGLKNGIARKTDIFNARVGEIDKRFKHPAMYPLSLALSLVETFSRPDSTILDPFCGSGTTLVAARELGRNYYGIDILQKFVDMANRRLAGENLLADRTGSKMPIVGITSARPIQ